MTILAGRQVQILYPFSSFTRKLSCDQAVVWGQHHNEGVFLGCTDLWVAVPKEIRPDAILCSLIHDDEMLVNMFA